MYRLFLSQRYLRSRLVNLIAVGGVMFGVAVLIVVTSVMDGFRSRVMSALRGNLSDIVMTPLLPEGQALPPYETMDAAIRKDPRVVATSPQTERIVFYLYPATGARQLVVNGHAVQELSAVGIDFDREKKVSAISRYLVAAEDPEHPFRSRRADEARDRLGGTVLVSRTFAKSFLGLEQGYLLPKDLIGTEIQITFLDLGGAPGWMPPALHPPSGASPDDPQASEDGVPPPPPPPGPGPGAGGPPGPSNAPPSLDPADIRASSRGIGFVISGVYDGDDTSLDATRLYFDQATLRKVAGIQDEYHVIRVKLRDPDTSQAVKSDFQQRFPSFETTVWQDHRRQYLRAVNNEKVLLMIVLSFIVLLGGFIILATLTLTVVEKTRDIGVLAALGANRSGILSLFVGTALLIGTIGALFGVGLGWLFTDNVNTIKDFLANRMGIQIFPADIYLFREIPTVWDWSSVLWIAGGSVLMAVAAGVVPALRAARMDPVRALRYE